MNLSKLLRLLLPPCLCLVAGPLCRAQINTEQVMRIGANALYFEDYMLAIQYFNQAIGAKPYLAQPYFLRSVAKLNLDDFNGAEADASAALERNPFITDAWEVRGVARSNMGRFAEAVEDYDHALLTLPDNRGLLFNKAIAQQEAGDLDGASATFAHLLEANPAFDSGYVGRARLNLLSGDTLAAAADADRAIQLNPNATNAYVIRADIAMNSPQPDYEAAIRDMDAAIRLSPRFAGYFVNRAYLRYKAEDLFGAMADFDYAIQLDPTNVTALYNRALLRAEVGDTNRAIADLSEVLRLRPGDNATLFNRAILYHDIGDLNGALADLDRLIETFPDFAAALYLRYEVKTLKGDRRGARADYDRSIALAATTVDDNPLDVGDVSSKPETQEEVEARFRALVALSSSESTPVEQVYNNPDIKGRVQDRDVAIGLEPMMELTYYISPNDLHQTSDYAPQIDELNATHTLKFLLRLSSDEHPSIDEDLFALHSASIREFSERIAAGNPRAIDFFGRAMDRITLRDYEGAVDDLNRAIEITPDFTLAYLARAAARLRSLPSENSPTPISPSALAAADIDKVIELAPRLPAAFYDKGILLAREGDMTSAIAAFSKAIELAPDFGRAFYNRGFAYLSLGNREAGIADLSRAGELGVISSYNLLKRMRGQ